MTLQINSLERNAKNDVQIIPRELNFERMKRNAIRPKRTEIPKVII